MLGAFRSAFATPDLRRKILITLGILAVYRLGCAIPAPGVDLGAVQAALQQIQGSDSENIYSLINLFSGGALLRLSIFALGIMPYITASIIVQLLTVVIPKFEQLKKEGQSGQQTMTQYTRYLTIGLAVLQSTGIVALAARGGLFPGARNLIPDDSIFNLLVIVVVMTAGTGVIMWMGEQITERGIGNGMSLLIFTAIGAQLPYQAAAIFNQAEVLVSFVVCVFALALVASVVFIELGQRRIPVQYAKRMVGRRMYGGTSTYLPLKVNQAGVIPVIFASSLLYLPNLLRQLTAGGGGDPNWFQSFIATYLSDPSSPAYVALYFLMIIGFTYFYVEITFNPEDRAEEMKKFGGFIPGIRPGRPTAEYLQYVLSRITSVGSVYLGIIVVLPFIFLDLVGVGGATQGAGFLFGGVAVLILVGVGLNTVQQIESQLMQRNYEGFLR